MTLPERWAYRSATFWFVVALVALQAIAAFVLFERQKAILLSEARQATHDELTLIESLVREPLLRHDYTTVIAFLERWGAQNPEVRALRAVAANGFVLVDYRRPLNGAMTLDLERTLEHQGDTLIDLRISRTLLGAQQELARLGRQLLAGALLFTALLGISLWRILQRLGLQPLKREIERRAVVEEALRRSRDLLDQKVQARTRELTEANRKLVHLANYDPLTGLGNRRLLDEELEKALRRSRHRRTRLALFYLDLDRFKDLNDSLGHVAGDELLVHTANRLRECAGDHGFIARFGGDEFVLVQETSEDNSQAALFAETVLDRVRQPVRILGNDIYASASVGIAVFPDDGDSVGLLLRSADAAMYMAKREGSDTFRFSNPELGQRAAERLWTENRLRRAISEGGLELYYQPQYELAGGKPIAYEALLRWRDPKRGLLLPDSFIPMAEESGLIHELGQWVVACACREARYLQDNSCFAPRIAVNVSGRQFRDKAFGRGVVDALDRAALPGTALEIELTETHLMADSAWIGRTLHELKELGLRVAIDDFGTGYSSLAYLKRFPIDTIKIDKSFIHDVTRSADNAAIVDAVLAMSNSLGYDVVAEGVETEGQARHLRRRGCRLAQGFLFGRPEPVDTMLTQLRESWCPTPSPAPGAG